MKISLKKINVLTIFSRHFQTLTNSNTHKSSFDDWFVFLFAPIIISVILTMVTKTISDNTLNLIITALSIFVGLLINVVVLIFSVIQKEDADSTKIAVLQETIINICYTILISIITILISFMMFINNHTIKEILSSLIYFLTAHFFITLLMIIKRMFLLFMNEIERD